MKKIIIKYLNDSISNEDLERLNVWLKKSKNQEKFKDFVRLNHQLNALHGKADVDEAYKKVLKNISSNKTSRSLILGNFLKYAAIFIGVSIMGYGIYKKSNDQIVVEQMPQIVLQLEDGTTQIVNEGENTFISNADGQKITEQKNQELVYAAQDSTAEVLRYNILKVPYGKTFGVNLSDGSKVILNAGSELKYPVAFIESEKNRTVYLNGEAFFEVSRNEEHPFIVNTQDMDVEVLGTTFNVTSYTQDYKTYTVLVEGKVAAHNKLSEVDSKVMEPNQKVYFDGNHLQVEDINVQKYVAWVHGQLVFIDDSFKVIENKLERKYNVSIDNQYIELDAINITATFKDETMDQVLKTFQTYKAFDYNIKDGLVTITKPE